MISRLHSVPTVSTAALANPLLDGITLPRSDAEIVRLLALNPFHDSQWRAAHCDPNLLKTYLRRVVIPTRSLIRVAKAMYRALAASCTAQNPTDPDRLRHYYSSGNSIAHVVRMLEGDMNFVGIRGITGTGKSHAVKAVLNSLPRMLVRHNLADMDVVKQVVWLLIDMTDAGTLEAFANSILRALGTALEDPDHFERSTRGVRSIDAKLSIILTQLRTYFCGILVVDEAQLRNFAGESRFRMRDFLVKVANSGVAVVVAGNPLAFGPEGNPHVGGSDQQYYSQPLRRMHDQEHIRLDVASGPNDPDWITLVRGLWPCQILRVIAPLTDEIIPLLYTLTGGFPGHLEPLLRLSQDIAWDENASSLSLEHLHRAAVACFSSNKKRVLIDTFLRRDPMLLRLCKDIDHAYYEEKWGIQPPINASTEAGIGTVVATRTAGDPDGPESARTKVLRTAKTSVTKSKGKVSAAKPNATQLLSDYHQEKLGELIREAEPAPRKASDE